MSSRKVITIFMASLTSALNIKNTMGDNIMMIKTRRGWDVVGFTLPGPALYLIATSDGCYCPCCNI